MRNKISKALLAVTLALSMLLTGVPVQNVRAEESTGEEAVEVVTEDAADEGESNAYNNFKFEFVNEVVVGDETYFDVNISWDGIEKYGDTEEFDYKLMYFYWLGGENSGKGGEVDGTYDQDKNALVVSLSMPTEAYNNKWYCFEYLRIIGSVTYVEQSLCCVNFINDYLGTREQEVVLQGTVVKLPQSQPSVGSHDFIGWSSLYENEIVSEWNNDNALNHWFEAKYTGIDLDISDTTYSFTTEETEDGDVKYTVYFKSQAFKLMSPSVDMYAEASLFYATSIDALNGTYFELVPDYASGELVGSFTISKKDAPKDNFINIIWIRYDDTYTKKVYSVDFEGNHYLGYDDGEYVLLDLSDMHYSVGLEKINDGEYHYSVKFEFEDIKKMDRRRPYVAYAELFDTYIIDGEKSRRIELNLDSDNNCLVGDFVVSDEIDKVDELFYEVILGYTGQYYSKNLIVDGAEQPYCPSDDGPEVVLDISDLEIDVQREDAGDNYIYHISATSDALKSMDPSRPYCAYVSFDLGYFIGKFYYRQIRLYFDETRSKLVGEYVVPKNVNLDWIGVEQFTLGYAEDWFIKEIEKPEINLLDSYYQYTVEETENGNLKYNVSVDFDALKVMNPEFITRVVIHTYQDYYVDDEYKDWFELSFDEETNMLTGGFVASKRENVFGLNLYKLFIDYYGYMYECDYSYNGTVYYKKYVDEDERIVDIDLAKSTIEITPEKNDSGMVNYGIVVSNDDFTKLDFSEDYQAVIEFFDAERWNYYSELLHVSVDGDALVGTISIPEAVASDLYPYNLTVVHAGAGYEQGYTVIRILDGYGTVIKHEYVPSGVEYQLPEAPEAPYNNCEFLGWTMWDNLLDKDIENVTSIDTTDHSFVDVNAEWKTPYYLPHDDGEAVEVDLSKASLDYTTEVKENGDVIYHVRAYFADMDKIDFSRPYCAVASYAGIPSGGFEEMSLYLSETGDCLVGDLVIPADEAIEMLCLYSLTFGYTNEYYTQFFTTVRLRAPWDENIVLDMVNVPRGTEIALPDSIELPVEYSDYRFSGWHMWDYDDEMERYYIGDIKSYLAYGPIYADIYGDMEEIPAAPATFTGFKTEKGKTYYYINDELVTGWAEINGAYYYFMPSNGAMLQGRYKIISGVGYTFAADGKLTKGGWTHYPKGSRYYWAGEMATGWTVIEGEKYYFDADGYMAKGTIMMDGVAYTFTQDGVYVGYDDAYTGFIKTKTGTYYYENAEQVTGWVLVDGKYYYFNPADGGKMRTQNKIVSGVFYYINADGSSDGIGSVVSKKGTKLYRAGVQIKGETVEFNGQTYVVDAKGWATVQ